MPEYGIGPTGHLKPLLVNDDGTPRSTGSVNLSGVSGAMTTTSDATVIAAQGAGISINVVTAMVTNIHATVATEVVLKNGGTTMAVLAAGANGGNMAVRFDPPIRWAANTAVIAACNTTGASCRVSVSGFKST